MVAFNQKGGVDMIDPVERDLKEDLRWRDEEHRRRCACEGRWDDLRENLKTELDASWGLLNPFHKGSHIEKLDAFLDRLSEIYTTVEDLRKEWK